MAGRLARLHEFARLAERTRFVPAASFAKSLEVKHEVQASAWERGGYSGWDESGCHFGYTVPAHACVEAGDGFPLSGVLAVIDEASTMAGVAVDRYRRPGQSVQLQVHRLRSAPIRPGERLSVVTTVSKLGRAMGFLSSRVTDEAGDDVAIGTHIKYLVMPPGWNLAFGKGFGLTQRIASLFEHAPSDAEPAPPPAKGALLPDFGEPTSAPDGSRSRPFTIDPSHLNGTPESIAAVHGGCQAMLHEIEAAAAASEAATSSTAALQCQALEVSYLASSRNAQQCCVTEPARPAAAAGGVLTTSRIHARAGGPVVSVAQAAFAPVGFAPGYRYRWAGDADH